MGEKQKMETRVKAVLDKLAYGQVVDDMYGVVREYQSEFLRMGITPYDLKELLELKAKVAFLPDSFSYSLSRPGRGDYILANFDNPSVAPVDNKELQFMEALYSYYQQEAEYKRKLGNLSQIAKEYLKPTKENSWYQLGENQEIELLTDIVLNQSIDKYPYSDSVINEQRHFLEKFDLYNAYHIDDDRITLRWKAGEVLESKGLLQKGSTERVLREAGVSVNKLKDGLCQHEIDRLRISNVKIFTEKISGSKYIRCRVDGDSQPVKELSVRDAELLGKLGNETGIAIKYYADVLDKNWKHNRMIADEKTLERMSMPYVDRLIDIYRNGMNEQDVLLSKASENKEVDSFWWDTMLLGLGEYSVENQKKYAFGTITDYISGLRPGMLTNDEVLSLVKIGSNPTSEGREMEKILMDLPKSFFPLIEQSGEYDRDVIDYVKVLRGAERITPTTAYNSMCYFLSTSLHREWDPVGADDEYGQVTGGYFYPNKTMANPVEKFPPNLLNEQQWSALGSKYSGEAASFIPYSAFRKNRITGVQVYPLGNGDLNIRCMVDGEQQGGKRLSEEDAGRYRDEKTDLNELAVGYFTDAFAREGERNVSLRR